MGEIDDAIERADREAFTKDPPKTLKGQIGFMLKQFGSAKAVAAEIGVTADSVNRYRRGARKHARPDVAAKIDNAVKARWQPLVRKRRQKQAAASGGITVETRARFGYTAPVGTTDDGRFRRLTVHLPPEYAQRLFDARHAGASDQQMRGIIAEGFKEVYFQDGGGRAMGLSDVEINDIDYLDLDY
ncbi:telomere-protecting terminal protein Tpg [Streptomyces sp. NPDC002755]|uniref:telomere-protecting terminal protein Tpg n=1 Tax=Streptomyces sp. NPDC002884 TaxID=3154544 RepID=UPI00331D70C6